VSVVPKIPLPPAGDHDSRPFGLPYLEPDEARFLGNPLAPSVFDPAADRDLWGRCDGMRRFGTFVGPEHERMRAGERPGCSSPCRTSIPRRLSDAPVTVHCPVTASGRCDASGGCPPVPPIASYAG
jgi:hypothetical protein